MSQALKTRLGLLFFSVFLLIAFLIGNLSKNNTRFDKANKSYIINTQISDVINSDKFYNQIKETREVSEIDLLTKLDYDDYSLAYDASSKTYYYSIIENDSEFDPLLRFHFYDINSEIAFGVQNIPEDSIRDSYRFIVYTDQVFSEYNLVLTTLPLVEIHLDEQPENMEQPVGYEDVSAQIRLFDNRESVANNRRVVKSQCMIHVRGATSRVLYPKNSYRISLKYKSPGEAIRNNHISLLGMRQDDDWILYAPYNDPEKIRNNLSHELWWRFGSHNNRFGISTGTKGHFVELLLDGRYWGIYNLMHPIDAKQLSLNNTSNPETTDYLYRSIIYEETTTQMFLDASGSNIAGKYELRWPENTTNTFTKWAPLSDYQQVMNAENEEFLKNSTSAVDIDNAIDIWLFTNLTLAVDNVGKNVNYIAKYRDGKYTMLFSPWDLDQTWGNIWTEGTKLYTEVRLSPDTAMNVHEFGISRSLELGMEGLAERIQNRYQYLRSSELSDEAMKSLLAEYRADVFDSGANKRDHDRWTDSSYKSDMTELEAFVLARLEYMDQYIASLGV